MSSSLTEASVVANGIRFHYATQGQGPLVLLLHGFPERWFSFRHQIPALAEAGFRVVAPDLRGYGESDRPPSGYDLPTLAADVAALIPALGAKTATVIGHDWGGAITWEAATRYPERIPRYAVLNAPHPAVFFKVLLRSPAQLRRSWYMFFFQLPYLPERMLTQDHGRNIRRALLSGAVNRSAFDEATLQKFCDSATRPGAIRPMLAYYRTALRGLLHPLATAREMAAYPTIEQPGLLLWAEDDVNLGLELVPPHLHYARDLRVHRIARCGHCVQQEQPQLVNTLLREFLMGPSSGPS